MGPERSRTFVLSVSEHTVALTGTSLTIGKDTTVEA